MNGIHDLGGMDGFGRVVVEQGEPVFHHAWERRVFAMTAAMMAAGLGPVDAFRFAVERMAPERYLRATYYERWLTALATRLVEHGLLTPAELDARAGAPFPLASPRPALPPVPPRAPGSSARFALGDVVRARNEHPHGHTRCPRYVRGKRGTVVRVDGRFALPDLAARHAASAATSGRTAFASRPRELWGESAAGGDLIHVDLWESYLEPP